MVSPSWKAFMSSFCANFRVSQSAHVGQSKTQASKSTSTVTALTSEDVVLESKDKPEAVELSKEENRRLRQKIDKYLLPQMMMLYFIQFVDKSALNASSILGLNKSLRLTAGEYNWLGTIFFVAFLLCQFPQNLALQRFPIGPWLGFNCLVWAISLGAQAACTNFKQTLILRFILGACEACVTPGFMLVTAMFYTHKEQSTRTGYWFFMSGVAQIASGLMSYGILYSGSKLALWRVYDLITASITLVVALCIMLFFPSSPTTAWFLTKQERLQAVQRIKINQTGIEDKKFNPSQAKEALKDPKTWIWFVFCILVSIPTSLSNQISIIVVSFGYTIKQTTLLNCGFGVFTIISMLSAVKLIDKTKNSRGLVGACWYVPSILGAILIVTLPWNNRAGLLAAIFLTTLSATPFVIGLGWIVSTTGGHTKRVVVQATILIGYCFGNIVGPQMWKRQYKPRNRVPWAVITLCFGLCMCIFLGMRKYLKKQNKRRNIIGSEEGRSVPVSSGPNLDLTDVENSRFRYVH